MHIATFTNTYKPAINGVVTSILHFRKGLTQAGHPVYVFAPHYQHEDQHPERYVFRSLAIDLTESFNAAVPLPVKLSIDPILDGLLPDVIHSQHPFVMGTVAADIAKERNIPLVFTFHTRYDEYAAKYLPGVEQVNALLAEVVVLNYLKRTSHIIVPTESIRTLVNSYGIEKPISVIPTPIDLDVYQNLDGESIRQKYQVGDKDLLLYVGRISPEKNLPFLIDAFEVIHEHWPNAVLMLVGQGPKEEDYIARVEKMGLAKNVIFTGPVPNERVPHFAAAADLFTFASKTETQGLVLAEALAAGTPVVAVRAPGSTDVLNGGGGVLVPENKEEFANAVISILKDKERRAEYSAQALKVSLEYSIPSRANQMLSVYEEAIRVKGKQK